MTDETPREMDKPGRQAVDPGPADASVLVLLAHGSREPRWRASLEDLAAAAHARHGPIAVRLAYIQFSPPTLDDAVSAAVAAGARRIRVLPLFLAAQGHVERDVQPAVDGLRRMFPDTRIDLLPPIGEHKSFRELIARIAGEEGRS